MNRPQLFNALMNIGNYGNREGYTNGPDASHIADFIFGLQNQIEALASTIDQVAKTANERITSISHDIDRITEIGGETDSLINSLIQRIDGLGRELAEYKRKSDEFDDLTEMQLARITAFKETRKQEVHELRVARRKQEQRIATLYERIAKLEAHPVHIVGTFDGTSQTIYVNGKQINPTSQDSGVIIARRDDDLWDLVQNVVQEQQNRPHNISNFCVSNTHYVVTHVPSNDEVFIARQADNDSSDLSVISMATGSMDRIAREWLTYHQQPTPEDKEDEAFIDSLVGTVSLPPDVRAIASDLYNLLHSSDTDWRMYANELAKDLNYSGINPVQHPATSTTSCACCGKLQSECGCEIGDDRSYASCRIHGYFSIRMSDYNALRRQQSAPISTSHRDINDVAVRLYTALCRIRDVDSDGLIAASAEELDAAVEALTYQINWALGDLEYARPILAKAGLLKPEPHQPSLSTSHDDDAGWQLAKRLYDALSERHDGIQFPYSETDSDGSLGLTLNLAYDELKEHGYFRPDPDAPQFEGEQISDEEKAAIERDSINIAAAESEGWS
jgi:hypothetical protein